MATNSIKKISPIDGRYANKTFFLSEFFSEYALIKYRIKVEIEYFIFLCEIPIPQLKSFPKKQFKNIRNIYLKFEEKEAEKIKKIEKKTNHDIKAIEYFLKEKFEKINLGDFKEFIHFGLTSQDINNTAVPLSIKDFIETSYIPQLNKLIDILKERVIEWKNIPMLARTHGQPASPTKMGKEINVFVYRIQEQIKLLSKIPHSAKFGGATGNFNAHHVAYPKINWKKNGEIFVQKYLGLKRQKITTQIENYDHLSAILHNLCRINVILIDFSRDIWSYISLDYFKQKIKKGEIGSSAMPHKVNPIDFENAEGNLGMANAIYSFLSKKLPISRMQRDLTDSTVLRNIGVPFGHTIIAFNSLERGIGKLLIHTDKINSDLEKNWAVVAEAIQTILRREGYPEPYEALKYLTRKNTKINEETIMLFIESLDISEKIKKELRNISPYNYTGI